MSSEEAQLQESLSQSPGYLISTVARLLSGKTTECLTPIGLTLYEYVVLRLVSMNVHLSQKSIGSQYGIDPATMVDLIDRLEQRELLFRQRDQQDRRRYLLRLTPKGNKVLARATRLVKKQQKDFLAPLSDEEWESVRGALWKILQAKL